ncbi:MAG: AAA family ATPase [Nitrospirae bacterium]|nr:AAA family ATPase [Nitrospirota bacterium]
MAKTIAFAGKGGTGKTTLAALTVRYLIEKTGRPILAVDADSNSCLNEALGVSVHTTIGKIREESLAAIRSSGGRPGGMSTEELFNYRVQQSIIEAKGFDLLVMGRPEGAGCYCAANNIIRKYTDMLSDDYPFVVIDNEAGMEHLSRRTTHKVDVLFIVSDCTVKGIKTAKRIVDLVAELALEIDQSVVIINRAKEDEGLIALAKEYGLTLAGEIPDDREIFDIDLKGGTVFDIPESSNCKKIGYSMFDTFIKI